MSHSPLVTVIIPTYRRPWLLPRAIESVRRQSYRNLEILTVDDGSGDETPSVVAAIGDARIRYLRHERNKGLPAARNTGIRAARGEYIAFIDDDDEWRADKLERQMRAIRDFDAVLSMGIANGYPLRVHRGTRVTLADLRKGSFNPSSLLARANVLREVMFDESLREGEDWDAFIRIGQGYSIGWLTEPLLFYNEGGHERMTNEARDLSGAELEARTAMLHKHRAFFGERWFRYHVAEALLSYIGTRPDRWPRIGYAAQRCGWSAVARVLSRKAARFALRRVWRHVLWRGRVPEARSPLGPTAPESGS